MQQFNAQPQHGPRLLGTLPSFHRCRSYATVLNNTNISDEEREALIRGAPVDERNRSTADIYCALIGLRGKQRGCSAKRPCDVCPAACGRESSQAAVSHSL